VLRAAGVDRDVRGHAEGVGRGALLLRRGVQAGYRGPGLQREALPSQVQLGLLS